MRIPANVNEFSAYDEGIAPARHPSGNNGTDIELVADLFQSVALPFVPEDRAARNDAQLGDVGKIVDQSFGDPIAEIFRVLIAADVHKWQDRHRID